MDTRSQKNSIAIDGRTLLAALCAALFLVGGALLSRPAQADDDALYGPAAPPNSTFFRVFNATGKDELEVRVADKVFPGVRSYAASEFVFLPPGAYTLSAGGLSAGVNLAANRYYTAVLRNDGVTLIDNARYDNRLKSLVVLYNLIEGSELSLQTDDGRAVIEAVAANSSGTREVNPVKVDLALFEGGQRLADLQPVNLQRGRAFSLFVAGTREVPISTWVMN